MSDVKHGELVPYTPLKVGWPVLESELLAHVYTTYDLAVSNGRGLTYNATLPGATDISQVPGLVFAVEHIVAHPVEITSEESGEIWRGLRMVFIAPGGSRVTTCSKIIWDGLPALFAAIGSEPPWPGGRLLQLIRTNRRGKPGQFYALALYMGDGIPCHATDTAGVVGTATNEQSPITSTATDPTPVADSPSRSKRPRS